MEIGDIFSVYRSRLGTEGLNVISGVMCPAPALAVPGTVLDQPFMCRTLNLILDRAVRAA